MEENDDLRFWLEMWRWDKKEKRRNLMEVFDVLARKMTQQARPTLILYGGVVWKPLEREVPWTSLSQNMRKRER